MSKPTVSTYKPRSGAFRQAHRDEQIRKRGHVCADYAKRYEFHEDGKRFHGWECSKCGELIHTG